MVNIKPLQNRVLLRKKENESSKEEVTKGGIIMPLNQEPIKYGVVESISKEISNPEIKEGDCVLFNEFGGKEIKCGEEEYVLIDYKEITGIINFD